LEKGEEMKDMARRPTGNPRVEDYPLVRIEWVDSSTRSEWHDDNENFDEVDCTSVGILLKETDKVYVVTHSISVDGGLLGSIGSIAIPKCSVKSCEEFL
jgi:hypothetical protein